MTVVIKIYHAKCADGDLISTYVLWYKNGVPVSVSVSVSGDIMRPTIVGISLRSCTDGTPTQSDSCDGTSRCSRRRSTIMGGAADHLPEEHEAHAQTTASVAVGDAAWTGDGRWRFQRS